MTKKIPLLLALVVSIIIPSVQATDFEITPMVGYTFSDDLASANSGGSLSVSDDANFALAFAWQDTPNGQGMIMLNYVSHNFTSDVDDAEHGFDMLYAHFNGVAQFRQQNYVTTVSLGVGGAFAHSDEDNSVYPSLTAAIGTRYELAPNLALVTEARVYASLTKKDEQQFCQADICSAGFDKAVWTEANFNVGIAYKF